MTTEQKNKIYIYSAFGLILLMLIVLTILSLATAHRQSRDVIRLSSLGILRQELLLFYLRRNKFPEKILDRSEVRREEECLDSLCLYDYPVDPATGRRFVYISCFDNASQNCQEAAADALGYRLYYTLESRANGVLPGSHYATQEAMVN